MTEPLCSRRPKAATAGLGLVACCFLANTAVSERNNRRLAANDAQVVRTQSVLTMLEEVLSIVTEAEARERGFLITGDESFLPRYHAAVKRVPGSFERLAQLIGDELSWQANLAALRRDADARIDELAAAIVLRKSEGFRAARQAVMKNNGRRLMREMRALVDRMQGHQRTCPRGGDQCSSTRLPQ